MNFQVHLPGASTSRQHSYPFVSGDTFRAFADIIYDPHPPSENNTLLPVR